jgi:acyl-coenzyme A thioesterase PaaI-like protein
MIALPSLAQETRGTFFSDPFVAYAATALPALTCDGSSRYYLSGGDVREIRNPFAGMPGYHCFGCSPDNVQGLKMSFTEEGDEILCSWTPDAHFAGYGGILHGGIQAALHDEAASWIVFTKMHTAGVTERLEMDYRNPVRMDLGNVILRSNLEKTEGNKAFIRSRLFDGKGKLGSESLAIFFTLPRHIARKKMSFPDDPAVFFK